MGKRSVEKKNTLTVIVLSVVTALCCLALIIAGTYAVFSSSERVYSHLRAGTLDAVLIREKLTSLTPQEDGTLGTPEVKTDEVDFTKATERNLFDLEGGTAFGSGCYFEADLIIRNEGTVAFAYWIEAVFCSDLSDGEFASCLALSVTQSGELQKEQSVRISEGLTIGSKEEGIAVVPAGEQVRFTVTLAFVDEDGNDEEISGEVFFDLIVHAVRYGD